jgi:hypothetical protein
MATAVKSDNKKQEAELTEAPQENPEAAAALQPVVDAGNQQMMMESRAKASALVSLAETRSHRAAKLVELGDLEALRDEVGAIEDLLKKIARELA